MRTGPEVTVVIPTHNREALLPDTLRSALGQDGVDLEVVVVDDASDDRTPELLERAIDPRLRVIRHETNRGQSVARNTGIAAARGEWVAFLDDDDLWSPDKLRLQLAAARDASATWVYCGVLLVSPEGDVVRMSGPPDPAGLLPELLRRNVVQAGASTVLAKTARIRAVGCFDETLGAGEVYDLWIRLALDGPAAAVEEPLAAYRRHVTTVITTGGRRALADFDRVAERYADIALEYGVEFDRRHLEHWLDSELVRSLRARAMSVYEDGNRGQAISVQLQVLRRRRSSGDARRLVRFLLGERARAALSPLRRDPGDVDGSREPVPDWLAVYLGPPANGPRASSPAAAGFGETAGLPREPPADESS